jgi:hypothetical protein
MSFVIAAPEMMAAAAADLANVGANEVLAGISAGFGAHAQTYQGWTRRQRHLTTSLCSS